MNRIEILTGLEGTVVDFSNESDTKPLHIMGVAILTRDIQRDAQERIRIILRGDILTTTVGGRHDRVEEIACYVSDITPCNSEVLIFKADNCTALYKTRDNSNEENSPIKIPSQILTVKKATGILPEELEKLKTVLLKPNREEYDEIFIEETERRIREHQLELIKHVHTLLNDLNGKGGEVELF